MLGGTGMLVVVVVVAVVVSDVAKGETLPTLTLQPPHMFTLAAPNTSPLPATRAYSTGEEGEGVDAEEREKEEEEKSRPRFTSKNGTVSVYLGERASLDCTVTKPANLSVSWLRLVDDLLELLTWDSNTYANDNRYWLMERAGDGWRQWQLMIRDAQVEDEGAVQVSGCYRASHGAYQHAARHCPSGAGGGRKGNQSGGEALQQRQHD
ncbi:uncharacterized protein LOC135091761 [Scylla paramamosain]|uniref:uncharacterized protein LOC135091761 n=1 Tax=Scylla paramamosain TaxID=85552 RepID=UPI0030829B4B